MSSKAGYLKTSKQLREAEARSAVSKGLGNAVQDLGQTGYNILNTGAIQTGTEHIGRVLGSIAIPIPSTVAPAVCTI